MSAKISYKADSSAHSGVKLETPCSPSVPSISNWIKPEVSMLTSIMLVSVEHNWDLEHLILSYERILSSWTLTSSGVVSAWPPLTSAPAGSVSAVCPHHPPCGQKRGSPPDPDPTPDSPLQSRLQSQSNKLMIVSHLFVIYFTSYNGFIMVVGAYTRVLIKLDSHKSNFAHISVCPRWNTHIWDSKYTSYRIQAINHPGSSFIVIVNMIIFPPKDRLYIHTHTHLHGVLVCLSLFLYFTDPHLSEALHYLCVCVCEKAVGEVMNSENRIPAQLQVCFSACFSTTTCTLICMSPHFIDIQMDMCVCQFVYTAACCYWVSLAGCLLALDQHPEATSRFFEASRQQTIRMEINGGNRLKAETTNTS